jgi:protoporphyrinogen oxidase
MPNESPQLPVVVLGGGCAGLAAGLRLLENGRRVVLLEQADHVGGLAGGIRINGNIYEYGPHFFHTTDPEILTLVKKLLGTELIEYHRTIKIKFLDQYFKFPLSLSDILLKLPPLTVFHAMVSLAWEMLKGKFSQPAVETSETILQRYYGQILYKIFFKDYIKRVWGVWPSELSPGFARQRIPRVNILEEITKLTRRVKHKYTKETRDYVETVEGTLYTTRQGFSMITQRMADAFENQGGELILNATVKSLTRDKDLITSVMYQQEGRSQRILSHGVINTLPINEVVAMIQPELANKDILAAAQALQFRALVFVGLLVRRARVLPASFMYFREHSFNRISDLSYFNFDVQPKGSTLLVAEISCSTNDAAWRDTDFITARVIDELVAENLLTREDVLESHIFHAEHAYPIYTLNYEKNLKEVLDGVAGFKNLETAGRQGRFQYVNTHIAMKMAFEAADRLSPRLTTPEVRETVTPGIHS